MRLNKLLDKARDRIVKEWFGRVVDTYPADTSLFLKKEKDPFANPVGQATIKGLETLFDEILGEMNDEKIAEALDPIIRIRAIQDFPPSRASGFVLFLRTIVIDSMKKGEAVDPEELLLLNRKIDQICLISFDIYMKCREHLYRLKADEDNRTNLRALTRAGLITDVNDPGNGA